ncbi:MAG: diaminopimelate epimerase [Pseudomonadota bacterium]
MSLVGTPFLKMNGLGNDFVILDLRHSDERPSRDDAIKLAKRDGRLGCDQLITIETPRSSSSAAFMGIMNADGSTVEACGNAARCVGHILLEETNQDSVRLETPAETLIISRQEDLISVDMGQPRFGWSDIPLSEELADTRFLDIKLGPIDDPVLWGPSGVNVGNPHCIFFVDDVDNHRLDLFGPMVENHPLFPERANVSLAQVQDESRLRLRVWERGVGITKACGTAACASAVAASRRRLTNRDVEVELDGGSLFIHWTDDNHIIMKGPTALEFTGTIEQDDLKRSS